MTTTLKGTRLQIHDRRSEADRAYWLSQFSTPSRPASLPSDFPTRPDRHAPYHSLHFSLPHEDSAALLRATAGSDFLLHAALHASLLVCLLRSSGEAEGGLLCLGVPARLRQPARPAASPAAPSQALAVVVEVSPELTFRALLGATREALLAAYEHQHYPLDRLARELSAAGTGGDESQGGRLFETLLACDGVHGAGWPRAGQDVTVRVWRGEGGLVEGEVHYLPELHRKESVEWLWRRLGAAAAGGLGEPGARLSELEVLSEEERGLVLGAWAGAREAAADSARKTGGECVSVTGMVREAAGRRPFATAVEQDGERVSYGELWRMAGEVAGRLRRLGVGRESVVGLCAARGAGMVAGALGVLRAGGAYLPLDVAQPESRLRGMVEEAGVRVVIRGGQVGVGARGAWEGVSGLSEVVLEEVCAAEAVGEEAVGEGAGEDEEVSCASAAYVIYTSGSTGRPKGVVVTHGGLTNLVRAQIEAFEVGEESRVLQFASIGFDASVSEIFVTLAAGATLVLPPENSANVGAELVGLLRDEAVTVVTLPPSLLASVEREELPALRTLVSAGEACSAEVVERWGQGVRFLNAYGPTEASVCASIGECRAGEGRPSIGRPMPGARLYVLDRGGRPCGVGAPGELHVGGRGVARGYLKRAALTAERFVPDPFSGEAGARLYRTGDIARFLPDGRVEYLGRADRQVKVRGYRIELGEVEAHLRQHPAVREAKVIARERVGGHVSLIGYLIAPGATDELSGELLESLKERLPAYMLPSALVILESYPLTPNGKLDVKALPDPVRPRERHDQSVAPATPAERLLAEIWTQVLGLKSVSADDNFFELGGDSILSIQVIARANQAGLRLSPGQLFQHQTISALAAAAAEFKPVSAEQEAVAGEVPLTPIQNWFFEQSPVEPHYFNQALLLELRRPLRAELLGEAVGHLVAHHDALRLRFRSDGSGWRQVNAADEQARVFTVVDLSRVAEAGPRVTAEAAAVQASLDLAEGPLVRAVYFDLGERRPARLLLVIHHLAVDGISWRILLEDLRDAYEQLAGGGGGVALPPKTTSFKRWAEKLAEYAGGEALREEAAYWLDPARATLEPVPSDFPGETVNSVEATRTVSVSLTAGETQALLQEVPKSYRTQINDALLTALTLSYSRWSEGRHALLIDLEGHGREELFGDVDLSRTVGWFTSLYPVLLDLGEAATPVEALKRVKEQLRGVPNRGLGYGLLRYVSGDAELAARLRSMPQAEVSFNYLGQLDQVLPEETPWVPAAESAGPPHSPRGQRFHWLDIVGRVAGGCLRMDFVYSEARHRRESVERLAGEFAAALRDLIALSPPDAAPAYTPSDFPLVKLDQPTLDRLAAERGQIEDIYPLSPLQEGMLFHTLHAPESGVYVGQLNCTLRGQVNVGAFKRAWRRVVERYPILRTAFVRGRDGQHLQLVQGAVPLAWAEQDWTGLSPAEQQERLEAYLKADRERGFDVTAAPLMRWSLIRLSTDSYQFVWSQHHLLLDGWSGPLLLRELGTFYDAFRRGAEAQLPQPRPYREFIAWLQRQDMFKAQTFWRGALAGLTKPTELGGLLPEPGPHNGDGPHSEQLARLTPEETAALQTLAREHQLTLNTFVQGAWSLVLSRHSGEADVLFGATSSGRPPDLPGAETMVGLFINTLPVRVPVEPVRPLLEWLRGIQSRQAEARQYEYSSLVQVHGWSDVPRGLPLFKSILVFENYPAAEFRGGPEGEPDIAVADLRTSIRNSFPMTVRAVPTGSGLSLRVMHDLRQFGRESAGLALRHLVTLLRHFGSRPHAAVAAALTALDEQDERERADQARRIKEARRQNLKGARRRDTPAV